MAIELVDLKKLIEFIPVSERGKSNPTVFYIKPATYRDLLNLNKLFKMDRTTGEIEFSEADAWLNFLTKRIAKIDLDGKTVIDKPKDIEETLEKLPMKIGQELFDFVQNTTMLDGGQIKN